MARIVCYTYQYSIIDKPVFCACWQGTGNSWEYHL